MEPGRDRKAGRWTRMRLNATADEYGSSDAGGVDTDRQTRFRVLREGLVRVRWV